MSLIVNDESNFDETTMRFVEDFSPSVKANEKKQCVRVGHLYS